MPQQQIWLKYHRRSRYRTFAKVGTGLSFADFIWVRNKPWKQWDPKRPPKWLLTSKRGLDDKGDLYLEPEEWVVYVILVMCSDMRYSSFILKVKAAEITPTGKHSE